MATAGQNRILPGAVQIADILRQEICAGRHTVGQQLENERQMVERFGVSRATIRRALQILEKERMIVRQQGRGTFVCDLTQISSKRRATTLAALVFERQYFFDAVIKGACSLASQRGYLLAAASNTSEQEENDNVEAILRDRISGVLIAPRGKMSQHNYERLVQAGVKVVLLEVLIPGVQEDYVGADNALGTFMAVDYLAELDHRRIGYVGHDNPNDRPCKSQRLCGFLDGCTNVGITPRAEWIVEVNAKTCREPLVSMLSAEDRPTAVVAYNDTWAIRTIGAARQLGLNVPNDLSVIGFDDCILASNYDVPITSVCPRYTQIGAAAVEFLIDKLEQEPRDLKRSVLVMPTITVRNSTSRANA